MLREDRGLDCTGTGLSVALGVVAEGDSILHSGLGFIVSRKGILAMSAKALAATRTVRRPAAESQSSPARRYHACTMGWARIQRLRTV